MRIILLLASIGPTSYFLLTRVNKAHLSEPVSKPPTVNLSPRRHKKAKSFAPRTTDSTHGQRCAPNLLLDQPRATQANRLWVNGPHLPATGQRDLGRTWQGVLGAFQNVCTKHVVVWQVQTDMSEVLVTSALQRVLLA